jgi:hypothetical protein
METLIGPDNNWVLYNNYPKRFLLYTVDYNTILYKLNGGDAKSPEHEIRNLVLSFSKNN